MNNTDIKENKFLKSANFLGELKKIGLIEDFIFAGSFLSKIQNARVELSYDFLRMSLQNDMAEEYPDGHYMSTFEYYITDIDNFLMCMNDNFLGFVNDREIENYYNVLLERYNLDQALEESTESLKPNKI
ncbi:hypothetical protein DR64_1619 [Paraburkholderia xenovorans LB400]|jgi:hypothetical protein|uniref:Uncharacterized protein n=1 Tax=Paraburkholderia xenovorans (strain LB400) TaxID=266265 RepID=Q145D2_PARXL|nr:hypothetical protein [Paraburkholderia xenovorans]ABE29057.1 hypothetical protein Bxe_A3942 [Paraburkholderia xenovorans LB400]AIP33820.1 hypothetical protein DR64_1619 [Paraburkholderia xenovorans LB400]